MQKINFQNLPSTTTPINATNLNAIQTNAETAINGVASDLSTLISSGTVNNATKWNNREDKISQPFSTTGGSWILIVDTNGDIEHVVYRDMIKSDDTGWISLNSIIKYRKINNIVYVACENGGQITVPANGDYNTIGTLPEGYRPSRNIDFASHTFAESSKSLIGKIQSTGNINMYANVSNSYFGFTVSFPVD